CRSCQLLISVTPHTPSLHPFPTRRSSDLEQIVGEPYESTRVPDKTLNEALSKRRVGFGGAALERLGRGLHCRGQRVELVRNVGCKLAAGLFVDAQLVAKPVERFDQRVDLVSAAARRRQRRG